MRTVTADPGRGREASAAVVPLPRSAALGGVGAALVNAALFAAAVAMGLFPSFRLDPAAGAQMAVEPILLVSVVGVPAGIAAFALVRRLVVEPVRSFLWIAGGVLILSFAAPLAIPGTTLAQAAVLNLMHVVVAAVVVALVLRANR